MASGLTAIRDCGFALAGNRALNPSAPTSVVVQALDANAYDTLLSPTSPAVTCCPADLNADAVVDDADLAILVPAYNDLLCP